MKNLILGIALVGFAFGCKSNRNADVADPADANMPKAECTMKAECSMGKESCTAEMKAECASKKACCPSKAAPQN